MKRFVSIFFVFMTFVFLCLSGIAWSERICFETEPTGAFTISGVSESEIIKALELAVKHTEMKNTDNQYLSSYSGSASYATMLPSETKAQEMRRKAKEALEEAERKATSLEQHDKDIQFIRDTLNKVKGGK